MIMFIFHVESQGRTSGSSESEYLVPSKKKLMLTNTVGWVGLPVPQPAQLRVQPLRPGRQRGAGHLRVRPRGREPVRRRWRPGIQRSILMKREVVGHFNSN